MGSRKRPEQQQLFQLHNTFFIFLSSLALDGTLARIQKKCSASLSVLVCLKCSADFGTGLCIKGTTLLAEQAGCSRVSVHRAIQALVDEGLVEVVRQDKGKRSVYRLFDKVKVKKDGQDAGTVMVPFMPKHMGARLEDLATFRQEGELPARALAAGMSVNITLNITNIQNAQNVYVSTSEMDANLKELARIPAGPGKSAAIRVLKQQIELMEAGIEAETQTSQQSEAEFAIERAMLLMKAHDIALGASSSSSSSAEQVQAPNPVLGLPHSLDPTKDYQY